ncbi:MAG: DUF3883 domain-containing protein [Hyphomicrobiaceae bacterium]|nr:DUF3883 domain-containing protein [Hyphomicrobiaceae bacterium]
MAEKIALKRLGNSDLSFFEYHFRNKTFGDHRQKGINLNRDVFVDQFYPQALEAMGMKWPVLVTLFGPGDAAPYSPPPDARRPITYNNGKNWRLNGGTVPDDPGSPERFASLAPGDLALFRFRGDPAPEEVDVILISARFDADAHRVLDAIVPQGRRSMVSLTPAQLDAALAGVDLVGTALADVRPTPELEDAVEEVALGGAAGPALVARRGGRRLSPAELQQARDDAQQIGADGESLVNSWLVEQQVDRLEWTSQLDAAAPYDFRFNDADGNNVKMDAKSTTGPFARRIHISTSELVEAAADDARYSVARVYEIDEDGAKMRICDNFNDLAKTIAGSLSLPAGVRVDGFSIDPNTLEWGAEIALSRSEEDQQE